MSVAPVAVPSSLSRLTLSRRVAIIIAAGLLVILAVLLVSSVRQQSQTFDESTHLFAGYEYWKHADFGRNPEHPPIVKLLAALPLLPMGLHEPPASPISFFKGQDFRNGTQFLYAADADAILLRARIAVALFSLALGVLVFLAVKEMFGLLAAVFALVLFTFEPNLLANGALITTDMALACLLFAAVYAFYRYCNNPSASRLALCAIATGLTLVVKQSGILVLPILVLLALVDLFVPKGDVVAKQNWLQHLCRLTFALVTVCVVSYVIVWASYGFRYAARPGQLQMVPTLTAYAAGLSSSLQNNSITFLARHHLLPESYLYGWVDILRIPDVRPTFLFGHHYSTGRWYFFPAVFLVKTTLTLLILLLLAPLSRIIGCRRKLLFLTLPTVFFVVAAIASGMNMGIRYVLPIYPFCIVLAAATAGSLFNRSLFARVAVASLLLFAVLSSLHCYPNYLAYSNELFGGPSHTYRYATSTNDDWGQGLKWTRAYLDHHPDSSCWLAYYGDPFVNPAYYGIPCKPLVSGFSHAMGVPTPPVPSTITGTVLVSTTEADGWQWGPGNLNPYQLFLDRKSDATINNIILVYRGTFSVPLLAAQSNVNAARSLQRQGHLPQALDLAQTAAQQAPDSAEIQAALGQILIDSGRASEGHAALATALHLAQTNHPEFQTRLIKYLQRSQSQP